MSILLSLQFLTVDLFTAFDTPRSHTFTSKSFQCDTLGTRMRVCSTLFPWERRRSDDKVYRACISIAVFTVVTTTTLTALVLRVVMPRHT
jgi:hypothetical protein